MTAEGDEPLVKTPEQAAARIGVVTEAWLRRKAGQRRIPCTRFMGRIGFTDAQIEEITDMFHVPAKSRLTRR